MYIVNKLGQGHTFCFKYYLIFNWWEYFCWWCKNKQDRHDLLWWYIKRFNGFNHKETMLNSHIHLKSTVVQKHALKFRWSDQLIIFIKGSRMKVFMWKPLLFFLLFKTSLSCQAGCCRSCWRATAETNLDIQSLKTCQLVC